MDNEMRMSKLNQDKKVITLAYAQEVMQYQNPPQTIFDIMIDVISILEGK